MSDGASIRPSAPGSSQTDPESAPVRVLVADDDETLGEAIRDLIAGEADMELVGAASNSDEAIELVQNLSPDVALLDVKMPGGGGPRAAAGIAATSPNTKVLALSAYEDRGSVLEMLRSGAIGFLVKGTSPVEILEAVR